MRSSKLLSILILFLSIPFAAPAQETFDVLYLKNGSIIKGIIIEQIPNETLKIQTRDGSIFVYNFSEVSKITKESSDSGIKTDNKPKVSIVTQTKSPGTAALLSVLIPGMGNIYAEKVGTGLWHMVIISLNYGAYMSDPEENKWAMPLALLLHVWDIFEAYHNAIVYNEKLKKENSINLAPINGGIKFTLSMNF